MGLGHEIIIWFKWYGIVWFEEPWLGESPEGIRNFLNCVFHFALNNKVLAVWR